MRKADLQCGNSTHANGERDLFLRVSNVILPDYPLTLPARSAKECKSACLNNCSCSAYAYDRETCTVLSGDLLNLRQQSDQISISNLLPLSQMGEVINLGNGHNCFCRTGHMISF